MYFGQASYQSHRFHFIIWKDDIYNGISLENRGWDYGNYITKNNFKLELIK